MCDTKQHSLGYEYFSGEQVYGDCIFVPEECMDERWWYIDGIPGYMISDYGRVWAAKTGQFIKAKPMDNHGHMGVSLCVDGHRHYEYIHRLMAKAFIPNPNNYNIVRHLNDDPSDNCLDNLAWGTQGDNMRDCINNGHAHFITPEEREIGLSRIRKKIIATNVKTGEKTVFRGQVEASRLLGVQQSNIWKVLNGERTSAGGYYFEYTRGGSRIEQCD